MTFTISVYDQLLADLTAGQFTSATVIDALLLKSTYNFSKLHHQVSDVSGAETSGSGYARWAVGATFTVATVNDEIQYQGLSSAITFSTFTTTDWRYVVLFNHSTSNIYLCADSGMTNTQNSSSFTLDPGTDPFIRVVSP